MEPYRERIEDFMRRYWYEGNRALLVLTVVLAVLLVLRFRVVRVWRLALIGGVVVIGCIVVAYVALLFADLPTAVVCERGRTYVEATPHRVNMSFDEYRVGPCVFYDPESARTGRAPDPSGSVY